MKFLKIIPLFVAILLVACDSDSTSASGDSSYGTMRYEQHYSSDEASADCYIYEKGRLLSAVMEQRFGSVGEVVVVSQIYWDGLVKAHEEVHFKGQVSPDSKSSYCSQEKAVYSQGLGGTVSCTDSEIVSDADMGALSSAEYDEKQDGVLNGLKGSCDDFIDTFESEVLSGSVYSYM